MIVAVAFDTGGAAATRRWIRPSMPFTIPQPLRDIMGWTPEQCARAGVPTYPCLIDTAHIVAESYGMTNVPMAVWIDEDGRIVRPAEAAGATDGFRRMNRTTYEMPPQVAEESRSARRHYVDAIRDWVDKGAASRYALPADDARRSVAEPSPAQAQAAVEFRLGHHLHERGYVAEAQRHFDAARRLDPAAWHYTRQALELQETGSASGADFYAAVDALGARAYYPAVDL